MPMPGPTLATMAGGPTWDALLARCRGEGITVCRGRLDQRRGLWVPDGRRIWVDSRLCDEYAAPVLAHELTHVRRGDAGPQSQAVEEWIDERVATMYVDPMAYARAERIRGPYAACIADELDLPQWVIEAWQRRLQRAA